MPTMATTIVPIFDLDARRKEESMETDTL